MRVLQISKFFPPVRGGIESTVHELVEGLNRHGARSDVLCANVHAGTSVERMPQGYTVTRAGRWAQLLATSLSPSLVGHLRRLCAHYEVLHLHMPDPMAALALRASQREAEHCRVVLHWHSDVVRQRWALKVYEPLQEWLLARADAIVATSQPYADASLPLRRWRAKVSVVPIGISDNPRLPDDGASAARMAELRAGRRIVLAVGRCTYYKGFDVLIDAARHLPGDAVVLIAGSGGDAALQRALREQVRGAGLEERVHLVGQLDDQQLADHLAACEVFCLPSTHRSEAFGVAQLEAMRAGRPVVSSDIPGSGVGWVNRDGVTGLTVPPGDAAALGAALNRVLADDTLRGRMGRAARQRYEDEFTADQMTERTLRLYRRLGSGPARAGAAGRAPEKMTP